MKGLGTLSGQEWKEQKRFTMHQMRNLGFGKFSIEQHIKNNIGRVIDRIERAADSPLTARQLFAIEHFSIVNLLFGECNDRAKSSYSNLQESITNAIRSLGQVSLLTFFPKLARLVARLKIVPFVNRLKANFVAVNAYIKYEWRRFKASIKRH